MGSPRIDLFGIVHVKVNFIPDLKMWVSAMLGKFVWTTSFVQCDYFSEELNKTQIFKILPYQLPNSWKM